MLRTSKLALGTVQFGLDYGINNRRGRVTPDEVGAILRDAWSNGVDILDTAHAYGTSESTLGDLLERDPLPFRVVTKIDPVLEPAPSIRDSLVRLRRPSIYGCLMHNFASYEQSPARWDELRESRAKGLAERIGFSCYYPRELEAVLAELPDIDLVQLPFSVFDRRFEPYFARLKQRKVEIHVRSVFLQGLAFMEPGKIPKRLESAAPNVRSLCTIAGDLGVSVADLCLAFALSRGDIDRIVIGVDSIENLRENTAAETHAVLPESAMNALERLAIEDEQITVPSNWSS